MISLLKKTAALAVLTLASSVAVAQDQIRIDGSSTVYPVTEAVAEEYQKQQGAAKVTVGISGTGGGFKKFVRGETDVQNASRPILASEMAQAKEAGIEYIELPVAFDALTVMVSPKNTFVESLTVEELKKIWAPDAQGKVMKWNQVRSSFPDAPLKLYGAGSDSGTFDYFTEAITGKAKSSRGDYTGSEDDNVLVQGISGDANALGYFGYAYYAANKDKLKAVKIDDGKGSEGPVGPSEKTVLDGTYQPLSRPIFIYVNKKSMERPDVRKFVEFYLTEGPDLAKRVKYVPLPDEAYDKGLARVKAGQAGTVFGGIAEVGVKIDDLYTRPLTTDAKAAPSAAAK